MADRLEMQTKDLTEINIQKIAEIFPSCVTETKTDDGKTRLAVDFESLKRQLSDAVIPEGKERYIISWPGKSESQRLANSPTTLTLRPCLDESSEFVKTKNIYIEGDNLEALKLLRETYLGKVKMIYIDPPYNTGNDFLYDDKFESTEEEYSQISGDYDDYGHRMVINSGSNGKYHTDWLNMIYPRLILAKDLLSEDGVIFISIDDNEQANLKKMCDEIFGERNFVATLIWQKKFSRSNDATYFSTMHDFILCYARNNIVNNQNGWKIGLLPRNGEIPEGYGNPDNDPRGPWTSVILSAKSGSESLLYEITTPSGRKVMPPSGRYWSCSKETFEKWNQDGRIWYGIKGDGTPRKKTFLSEVQEGLRPNTILLHEDAGNNQEAKQELKKLFEGVGIFDGPKPVRLIKLLIKIANLEKDSIVLDFFSGAATTAQAVIETNAEEKSDLSFILIQIPEKCSEDSEAFKNGYTTICDIGKERIKRAGKQLTEQQTLDDNKLDVGFRVFKIDSSNMNDVFYDPTATKKEILDYAAENIKSDRSGQDLLIQVMLELGIELSADIQEEKIADKTIFTVDGDYLIACFDSDVDDNLVTEIAKRQPRYAVFRDSSMSSDSVAINFGEIFKTFSPNTQTKVL